MMKAYRVIGSMGRVTIPYWMRKQIGIRPEDVVSFEVVDENTVLVCRESIREAEKADIKQTADVPMPTLKEFLDSLTEPERYAAMVHLSVLWAENHGGKK